MAQRTKVEKTTKDKTETDDVDDLLKTDEEIAAAGGPKPPEEETIKPPDETKPPIDETPAAKPPAKAAKQPPRKMTVFAGSCPKVPRHQRTRVYKTLGRTRYCVCDDCGHTWKQMGELATEPV
jgi:hypothetical protein